MYKMQSADDTLKGKSRHERVRMPFPKVRGNKRGTSLYN